MAKVTHRVNIHSAKHTLVMYPTEGGEIALTEGEYRVYLEYQRIHTKYTRLCMRKLAIHRNAGLYELAQRIYPIFVEHNIVPAPETDSFKLFDNFVLQFCGSMGKPNVVFIDDTDIQGVDHFGMICSRESYQYGSILKVFADRHPDEPSAESTAKAELVTVALAKFENEFVNLLPKK